MQTRYTSWRVRYWSEPFKYYSSCLAQPYSGLGSDLQSPVQTGRNDTTGALAMTRRGLKDLHLNSTARRVKTLYPSQTSRGERRTGARSREQVPRAEVNREREREN